MTPSGNSGSTCSRAATATIGGQRPCRAAAPRAAASSRDRRAAWLWEHPFWSTFRRTKQFRPHCHGFIPRRASASRVDVLLQQLPERDHARPIRARPRHDEIVLLRLHRQESESRAAGDGIERHSPVGAALHHGGCHGIVIPRLHGIPVRSGAAEQPVDQHARAAALIAIDHHARGIVDGARDGILRRPAFEARVSRTEDDALQAAVTGDEIERRSQERPIVFVGLRIEQMDARDIAFAALGGIQSSGAAHGEKLRAHALPLAALPAGNRERCSGCRSRPDRPVAGRGPEAGRRSIVPA